MRKFDATYRISEADDVLSKENGIHEDLDRRLDDVEKLADDFRAGNRIDVEALIAKYNLTVAGLAEAVEDVLDQVTRGFPASQVIEGTTRLFLTPERRKAILDELRGDVTGAANTLGELYELIQARATPTDVAAAIDDVVGGATAARSTLGKLSGALDAVAERVSAITQGAAASRDTLVEVGSALDALATADGLRLRVDGAQAFSDVQKDQAASNAGLDERYARLDGANLGPLGSRNRFVNGNFEVWQRGTSITLPSAGTSGRYICDMVQAVFGGTGATMSYDRWIDEETLRPRLRVQTGVVPTNANFNLLRFYIEGARTLAGHGVAVSCTLKKYGTGPDFVLPADSFLVRQNFGTGGSPSSQVGGRVVQRPADALVTAVERRLTWVIDMPSVAGKTLGTNGDDHLQIQLYFPSNAAFQVLVGEMQFEEVTAAGSHTPTRFGVLPSAEYVSLCQRYYEKSYNLDDAPASSVTGGALQQRAQAATSALTLGSVRFAAAKRAVPAVTLYNPSTGATASPVRNTTTGTDLAGSVGNIGSGGFTASIAAAVAAGDAASVHWIADASF